MVPFASLVAALETIDDPRRPQGRGYSMSHLLLFSVLAVLSGATSYQSIITFMAVHRERLNALFGARLRRAPAVNTLRHLFCDARSRRPGGGLSPPCSPPGWSQRRGRQAHRRARWQDAA